MTIQTWTSRACYKRTFKWWRTSHCVGFQLVTRHRVIEVNWL